MRLLAACVLSFICCPATCGLKGHGSGGGLFKMVMTYPRLAWHQPVIVGLPSLLLPNRPKNITKGKEKGNRQRKNEKKETKERDRENIARGGPGQPSSPSDSLSPTIPRGPLPLYARLRCPAGTPASPPSLSRPTAIRLRGSWVFPPACLPYVLPQPLDLGGPCVALSEEVAARRALLHHQHSFLSACCRSSLSFRGDRSLWPRALRAAGSSGRPRLLAVRPDRGKDGRFRS